MPSIAEIIAAKKAKAAVKTQVSNEDRELDEALDRIDPPKKHKALVLSASTPLPAADVAQTAHYKDRRSLGETDGEGIDLTPLTADQCIKDWHKAVNAFSTDLCIMRDPIDPERAWLAVRLEDEPMHPLLLRDLPLYEHPRTARQANQPF